MTHIIDKTKRITVEVAERLLGRHLQFEDLLGMTLLNIRGMHNGSDEVELTTTHGWRFVLKHTQGCCEVVTVYDVVGDPNDLIGSPIKMADEATSFDTPGDVKIPHYAESYTWTFYRLATVRGYVTLRWLGESNGYYSESVDVEVRDVAT